MNNRETYNLLRSKSSLRAATDELLNVFQQPGSEFNLICRKFRELKTNRESIVKKDLGTWEDIMFYSLITDIRFDRY